MITLASVAISLTIGLLLINFAHGQENDNPYVDKMAVMLELEEYCIISVFGLGDNIQPNATFIVV